MASSADSLGHYGQLSQSEEMGASLTAPDPEDMAKPAAAVVSAGVVFGCGARQNGSSVLIWKGNAGA